MADNERYLQDFPELRGVQETELEILTAVDRVCREKGLRYFLDSGTALGAVRHRGFIPWDDDIDIAMPRSDYDRFMKEGQEALGDAYFLQNRRTDPKCPFAFAKVRKRGTVFREWDKRNIDMMHGIFIDIFPYDVLPEEGREEYMDRCHALNRTLILRMIPDRAAHAEKNIKWILGAAARRAVYYACHLLPLRRLDGQIEREFARYKDQRFDDMAYTCHSFSKKYVFPEALLFPTQLMTFEGHEFSVPAKCTEYLSLIYGDYMTLPPEDKRRGHRPVEVRL